jgi:DNA repair ATPase RecN
MKTPIPETKKLKAQLIESNLEFRKLKDEYQKKSIAAKTEIKAIRDLISTAEHEFLTDRMKEIGRGGRICEIARKYQVSPTAVVNWRKMERKSKP